MLRADLGDFLLFGLEDGGLVVVHAGRMDQQVLCEVIDPLASLLAFESMEIYHFFHIYIYGYH